MTMKIDKVQELSDHDLDDAQGGLLLPAVQKAREAARRTNDTAGDGVTTFDLDYAGGVRVATGDVNGDG